MIVELHVDMHRTSLLLGFYELREFFRIALVASHLLCVGAGWRRASFQVGKHHDLCHHGQGRAQHHHDHTFRLKDDSSSVNDDNNTKRPPLSTQRRRTPHEHQTLTTDEQRTAGMEMQAFQVPVFFLCFLSMFSLFFLSFSLTNGFFKL